MSKYYNFALISGYSDYVVDESVAYNLSEATIEDVDFHESFKVIDHTHSAIGIQVLYSHLRLLNPSINEISLLEKRIALISEEDTRRFEIRNVLKKLTGQHHYDFPILIFEVIPERKNWFQYVKYLRWLTLILVALSPFFPFAFVSLIVVFGINMMLHLWLTHRMNWFFKLIARLGELNRSASKLKKFSCLDEINQKKLESSIDVVRQLSRKADLFGLKDKIERESLALVWTLLQSLKALFLSSYADYEKIADVIEGQKGDLDRVFRFIGEIDVAMSTWVFRSNFETCRPTFLASGQQLSFENLRHPLVKDCVSNDLTLNGKSLLLTGSNMSGKSTFIKAINLNVIMAQTLNTVVAKAYKAPKLDISTSIRMSDNLINETSYYMREVETIGRMLEESEEDRQYLFTIDEIFKGTNTVERISAAKAILEYLNRKDHLILISTHDIELTALLNKEFDQYYFQENVENGVLSFDYKLKPGKLENRNAIKILELSGYPKQVTDEAHRLAKEMS